MSLPETKQNQVEEDKPPIFRSWNQLYAFVLVMHAIIILLFYLFTHHYS